MSFIRFVSAQSTICSRVFQRASAIAALGLIFALSHAGWGQDKPAEGDLPPILKIGSQAPDFNLPGVDGKAHRLTDYASSKVLVVIFSCNHCPVA